MSPPLVLVGHGSRDARSATALSRLADRVRAAGPDLDVRLCFLELSVPSLEQVLGGIDGPAVVVPLLLGDGHHARADVPARVAAGRPDLVRVAPPLGRDPGLAEVVADRARQAATDAPVDGWVLVGAGSAYEDATAPVRDLAAHLSGQLALPVRAAFATAAAPDVTGAVARLRAEGCRAPGLLPWFLAPGLLLDRAVATARGAGVRVVAEPLADHALTAAAVLRAATGPADRCTVRPHDHAQGKPVRIRR